MDEADQDVVFRVDERDRIAVVNEAWDRFAAANGGAALTSRGVLQRSLWDYVSDPTTRVLYRRLLERARAGRTVRFTFRCDAPNRPRLLQMTVSGQGDGTVEFCSRPVEHSPHWPPGDGLVRACAWCQSVEVGGAWVDVASATERLRLFELHPPPRITHGICPPCLAAVDSPSP